VGILCRSLLQASISGAPGLRAGEGAILYHTEF
jgi:hypothetical protein